MKRLTPLRAIVLASCLAATGVSVAASPGPNATNFGRDYTAQQAPGGPAVPHRAGGTLVTTKKALRAAPRPEVSPVGTQAAEPTMGIAADGTLYYVGADFVPFSASPDPNDPPRQEWPVMRSDDSGQSWTEVSPRLGPKRRHAGVGLDPMLHVDPTTGRVFTADLQLQFCATVSFSDDKGTTWRTSEACGLSDHQNLFTGRPVTSPTVGYPNIVYYCAIDGGALAAYGTATSCLKSLDGGLTWARTGAPAYNDDPTNDHMMAGVKGHCGGGTGHGFVDSKA